MNPMDPEKRSREMRGFFNARIGGYEERHMLLIEGKEKIVEFIPKDAENIIDSGAGTGLQLLKVYREFPDIKTTAIDVSDVMLQKLAEKHISPNIRIVNEDYFAEDDESEADGFENYRNLVRGEGKHYDTPLTVEHETAILKEAGFGKVETVITDKYIVVAAYK